MISYSITRNPAQENLSFWYTVTAKIIRSSRRQSSSLFPPDIAYMLPIQEDTALPVLPTRLFQNFIMRIWRMISAHLFRRYILKSLPTMVSAMEASSDFCSNCGIRELWVSWRSAVSKTFVTVAALQIAEEGKIDIDQPVTDYLPEFRMADERYQTPSSAGFLSTELQTSARP